MTLKVRRLGKCIPYKRSVLCAQKRNIFDLLYIYKYIYVCVYIYFKQLK